MSLKFSLKRMDAAVDDEIHGARELAILILKQGWRELIYLEALDGANLELDFGIDFGAVDAGIHKKITPIAQ